LILKQSFDYSNKELLCPIEEFRELGMLKDHFIHSAVRIGSIFQMA